MLQLQEVQELAPGLGVVPESPGHAGGDGLAVDLLNPAHDHAGVHGLDDDADAFKRRLVAIDNGCFLFLNTRQYFPLNSTCHLHF